MADINEIVSEPRTEEKFINREHHISIYSEGSTRLIIFRFNENLG